MRSPIALAPLKFHSIASPALEIEAVKKLQASRSLNPVTSRPTPSSKDWERGKTETLKLAGVDCPALISNNFNSAVKFDKSIFEPVSLWILS